MAQLGSRARGTSIDVPPTEKALYGDLPPLDVAWELYGRRFDPKSKNKVETLNTIYSRDTVREYIDALREAVNLGYKIPSADDLAAIALIEGREDFGYNSKSNLELSEAPEDSKDVWQTNYKGDPKVQGVYDALKDKYGTAPAGFAALVAEKQRTAERLGVPFSKAWNGMGTNKYGQSGDDYATRVELTKKYALSHPSNRVLYQTIKDTLEGTYGVP